MACGPVANLTDARAILRSEPERRLRPRPRSASDAAFSAACLATLATLLLALPLRSDASSPEGVDIPDDEVGLEEQLDEDEAADQEDDPLRRWLPDGLEMEIDVEATFELERNIDLDDEADSDIGVLEPEIGLSLAYEFNDHVAAELGLVLNRELFVVDRAGEEQGELKLEIDEAFVYADDVWIEGLAAQIGRQRIRDERREWLVDENLDGVRLIYDSGPVALEASVSREKLLDKDLLNADENPRINNYLVMGDFGFMEDATVGAYAMFRDDRTGEEGQPLHLGVRSHGWLGGEWMYWLDLGHVRGRDNGRDIEGYAVDLGVTYAFDLPLEPSLTLGYAWGSGDSDPDDDTDRAYRQTGLHDNDANFNGLPRFKYYGEVFDPELSNLHIFTAGVGIRDGETSSLDLVWHHYRQSTLADEIRDSRLDGELRAGPRSKALGHEVDLIYGYRGIAGIENLGADLAVGYFWPGDAFSKDTNDGALFFRIDLAFAF